MGVLRCQKRGQLYGREAGPVHRCHMLRKNSIPREEIRKQAHTAFVAERDGGMDDDDDDDLL